MTKNDIHDLMVGAVVSVLAYAVWQHFKAKKQAQVDAKLAASTPQEIKQWDDPNSPVFGLPPDLATLLQSTISDGLNMPITYEGQ